MFFQRYFHSLEQRRFDSLVLHHASDADVFDFVANFPSASTQLHALVLRGCNVSDRGLEAIMEFLKGLFQIEIAGNDESLWLCAA